MCIRDSGTLFRAFPASHAVVHIHLRHYALHNLNRSQRTDCVSYTHLLDQWKGMEKDGKWRFTSPTHVVLAFSKALDELAQEGGIPARSRRYTENNRLLIEKMRAMGFATYIDGSHQGPIITTFFYPAGVSFRFEEFYRYIKERGYAIYPGKLTEMDTFRIGNIGEIYPEDIDKPVSYTHLDVYKRQPLILLRRLSRHERPGQAPLPSPVPKSPCWGNTPMCA